MRGGWWIFTPGGGWRQWGKGPEDDGQAHGPGDGGQPGGGSESPQEPEGGKDSRIFKAGQRLRRFWPFLGLGLLLLFSASTLLNLYVDWLWFDSTGFRDIFLKKFTAQILVGLVGGLLYGAILMVNWHLAVASWRTIPPGLLPPVVERWLTAGRSRWLGLAISGFFALLANANIGQQWLLVETFRQHQPFGILEPLFNRDAAFYVFKLPFYELVLQNWSAALFFSLILAGGLYFLAGAIVLTRGRIHFHPRARVHLAVLGGLLLAGKAVGYRLQAFALLHSPGGAAFGPGYTEVHATLPALHVMTGLTAVGALLMVLPATGRTWRWLVGVPAALVLASALLLGVWPAVLQRFVVEPHEQVREAPYLTHHIDLTRRAYGLDEITVKEYPASNTLDWESLAAQAGTLENIRLWDVRPLLTTYRQRQNIRQYYDFHDVDVDRYTIDGRYQQVMLSARELDHDLLDVSAQKWVNIHLRFTHGYGLVMSPASQVAAGGQPELYLRDIPPQASVDLDITRPEIYFGEHIEPYAIVGTTMEEFSYPVGDTIATTMYEGTAGVPIGSLWRRLIFSAYFWDYNILFSGALTPDSRVIFHRQVLPRLRKVAPFLRYDDDPYLIVGEDGHLYWMIDAYTTAAGFPYSQPYTGSYGSRALRGVNYLRNPVKVVMDAYNGDINFYVVEEDDAVLQTYGRIFPNLFQPRSEMPPDLQEHMRYPEGLLRVQADMYSLYHMTEPDIFFNREDSWVLPQELFEEAVVMDPYYLIMQIPGEPEPEFLLLVPFTPARRQNMIGWLAGRSDGERLGELIVFNLPKDRQIFGPMQVEDRINQHDEIARDLALWGQQGTRVIRGNLLIIPVADALLYVEPLYLRAADGGLPELRRVIVTFGDHQPVMAATLQEALVKLLGRAPDASAATDLPEEFVPDELEEQEGAPAAPAPGVADGRLQATIERANELYKEAQAALKRGDFAAYGEFTEELGIVLEELLGEMEFQP